MKLTKSQLAVIDRAKELEKEYGKGNVFLRYLNDYWKVCFIIHTKGSDTYTCTFKEKNRVNGRILNSLEEKGLTTGCDNEHNEDVDPNSWRSQPETWRYIGMRIKTEMV